MFSSKYVSRNVFNQMHTLYFRPHIDYGDESYTDQRMSLSHELESTQYKAALAVSGAWKDTNHVKTRIGFLRSFAGRHLVIIKHLTVCKVIFLNKLTFSTVYGILIA